MDSHVPQLLPIPIDDLALCAYSDEHYTRHREYWRSFLKMLLPTILERDPAEIEEIVEYSTLREWKELVQTNQPSRSVGSLMRHISACLSLFVGHPAELGFAAFLDCALPTRMHSLPGHKRHETAGLPLSPSLQNHTYEVDEIFVDWFSRLALKQSDENFLKVVAQWQDALHDLPMSHFAQESSVGDSAARAGLSENGEPTADPVRSAS